MTRATGIFHRFWSATGVIFDFAGLFVRFSETELSECPSGNHSVKHFLVFVTKIKNFTGLSTHTGAKTKPEVVWPDAHDAERTPPEVDEYTSPEG